MGRYITMCSIIAQLESKCRGCEYKRPTGCARSNYEAYGIRYYSESGMTCMLTSEGFIYYLTDIERCDKWGEK